jgi:hypothetical protein
LRRLLILLLFALVVTAGAALAWQAMGQARLVEGDLTQREACWPAPAASRPASSRNGWT